MVTTTERQAERAELVSQGYAWEYIKEWQPKIPLYRHAPGMDMEGNEAFPVGTPIMCVGRGGWECSRVRPVRVVSVSGV